MERRNEEGGMFRGEPTSWLVTMGVLGVYSVLFFGGNAVRCAVDGHWTIGGVLLIGAMVGLGVAISAVEEARRRRKAARREREKRERRMKARDEAARRHATVA